VRTYEGGPRGSPPRYVLSPRLVFRRYPVLPWCLRVLALPIAALVGVRAEAGAASFKAASLTFSDERGGFVIQGVSGAGTYEDPYVVIEEMTDPGGGTLVIRGADSGIGNRIGTLHAVGFAITKIVLNATGQDWTAFDLELQEIYGVPSDYYDGLSFGQGAKLPQPIISDRFAETEVEDEPYDEVHFRDGSVKPGDRLTLKLVITDATPVPEFYLLQRPSRLISALPSRLAHR
jgi:hypothetical protein